MPLGFIAVTYTGGNQLPYSLDGHTWQVPSSPISAGSYGVAYSPSLGVAVAPVYGAGSVNYTTDGLTWTSKTCPSSQWLQVCWSPEKALFVAVGESSPYVMTSPDGVTWTSRTAPGYAWHAICWSPQQSLFVAVANVTNVVMTSPDGVNWTLRTSALPNSGTWRGICWSPSLGIFVATQGAPTGSGTPDNAVIATSSTGTSFSTVATDCQGHLCTWSESVGMFVVPNSSARGSAFWTSSDGSTWTGRSSPSTRPLSVAYDEDAKVYVAVGQSGGQPVYSSDGKSWSLASGMDATRQWRHVIGCNIIPPVRRRPRTSVGILVARARSSS